MAKTEQPAAPQGRREQIAASYRLTKEVDPRIGLILLGTFVVGALFAFGVFFLVTGGWVFPLVIGLLFGLLAMLIVFGRRTQKAMYKQLEGRQGAAAAVLGSLRRGWKTDPAVAFNKNQDLVHRVVGPPGIVLVGEGNPARVRALLANEKRKHERVTEGVTVHEVVAGDGEGAVPIPKLVKHVTKLPKSLKPGDMTDVLARLRALDATRGNVPLPKGPMPTSIRGARGMRGR
ncbi:MAG: DUF4191 domain-containing protein [Nocardioidaceae bacterium]